MDEDKFERNTLMIIGVAATGIVLGSLILYNRYLSTVLMMVAAHADTYSDYILNHDKN